MKEEDRSNSSKRTKLDASSTSKLVSGSWFRSLGSDVLLKIFAFVPVLDLFWSVSKVDHSAREQLNSWAVVRQLASEWRLCAVQWQEDFSAELSSPERKCFAFVHPCFEIRNLVEELRKCNNVKLVEKRSNFVDNNSYHMFAASSTRLKSFVDYVHNKLGLQVPAFVQQLGSMFSYLGPKDCSFRYCVQPYGFDLNVHSRPTKEQPNSDDEAEGNSDESFPEQDADWTRLLLCQESALTLASYDWDGHGEGGQCLVTVLMDPKVGCQKHGSLQLIETHYPREDQSTWRSLVATLHAQIKLRKDVGPYDHISVTTQELSGFWKSDSRS